MTWSLIARDPATGAFGIAVATKNFAVGCRVPFIESGIGAVATQALVNPFYGAHGLKFLRRRDARPPTSSRSLTEGDEGRDHRQVHMMDAAWPHRGAYRQARASTGAATPRAKAISVAGNMLAGARCHCGNRESLCGERRIAVSAPADRRAARRARPRAATSAASSRRRCHLRRGGVARSRPARRRSRRSARRAGAAGKGQPRALGAFREVSCRAREKSARRVRPRGDRCRHRCRAAPRQK